MNQTFNIHRLALMLRLDFAEKGKSNLLTAALLILLLILMMAPITLYNQYSNFREALHYMALFMIVLFGASLYTSNSLAQFSSPSTGMAALMIPASSLEKFLSAWLMNMLFVAPFLLLFVQLHYFTIDIANERLAAQAFRYSYIQFGYVQYLIFAYFMIQSIVFLGSIYFTKAAYIKTAAFLVAASILLFTLHLILANNFTNFPTKLNTLPLAGWQIWYYDIQNNAVVHNNTRFYHITFPDALLRGVQSCVGLMALCFWYIAYLRIKEKEI